MTTPLKDLTHLRLLFSFAHPDDEGFGSGGTLAMLVARGAQVTLVCGTNGDVGEISDPSLATPETLAQVRQQELIDAMAVTGVTDIRFLNYRDSGMEGTEDNEHPNSLHQADPRVVVSALVEIMKETRPNVVVTHDPSGGYGHPDHKAMCIHTSDAYALAANDPEMIGSYLYFVCFPRSNFQRMWRKMVEMDISPPFASQDIDKVGTPDDEVTTVLDISEYVDTKIDSLNCHRTQINPDGPFALLPQEMMREIMGTEYYTLVSPKDAPAEADLLGGL
ncbi:MAG: PIG-L family deacetylase [Chloroflexota bacterium]|nr:PIG-L family deacetylase [Chloroflexota bacterium]